jgi:hypothetical protein
MDWVSYTRSMPLYQSLPFQFLYRNHGINISLHIPCILIRVTVTERAFQWESVCHEMGFNLYYKQVEEPG